MSRRTVRADVEIPSFSNQFGGYTFLAPRAIGARAISAISCWRFSGSAGDRDDETSSNSFQQDGCNTCGRQRRRRRRAGLQDELGIRLLTATTSLPTRP